MDNEQELIEEIRGFYNHTTAMGYLGVAKCMLGLSNQRIKELYQYYEDRWTWDCDSGETGFFLYIFELAHIRRTTGRDVVKDCLEAAREKVKSLKKGKYSIIGEDTDDANSQSSQSDNTGHDSQEHE